MRIVEWLLITVVAATASAELPATLKPAWQWTLEERLAVKYDATSRAARVRAAIEKMERRSEKSVGTLPRWVDVIDGTTHPELRLPHDLFDSLVMRGVYEDDWQDYVQVELAKAGLPSNFWERLEVVAAPFVADMRRQRKIFDSSERRGGTLSSTEVNSRVAELFPALCRHRAESLERARAEFGIALDKFLYNYIAPGGAEYYDEQPDIEIDRRLARGCR